MPGTITGKHMFYDAVITVNSVALSDHVEKVEVKVSTMVPGRADAMGDLQTYDMPGIQKIEDITVSFFQDYAAAKVYATLYAAWSVPQTIFNIVLKASSAATSATNPQWTIPVFVKTMPFMTGTHGDRHMADASFGCAGNYSVATS